MSDEIENTEIKNPEIIIGAGGAGEAVDELEEAFKQFNENNSNHKPEEQAATTNDVDPTEIDLSQAENFKLQIFISLMFTLLDGLHVFIYNFMSKYKLTREDIALDENDKQGLEIYFRTQRVMDLINRLPTEMIGFIHMEYLYFTKFQEFNKKMKELEPEEEEEEEESDDDDDDDDDAPETPEEKIAKVLSKKREEFESSKKNIDDTASGRNDDKDVSKKDEPKKAAPKKAATKKAASKKLAAKKAAPKKAAKKAEVKKPEEQK